MGLFKKHYPSLEEVEKNVHLYYVRREHIEEAEDDIHDYLKYTQCIADDEKRHKLQDMIEDVLKDHDMDYSNMWTHISHALSNNDDSLKLFIHEEIRRRLTKFCRTKNKHDRHNVEDVIHDYLKHILKDVSKEERKMIEDEIQDFMKYNTPSFDVYWEYIEGQLSAIEDRTIFDEAEDEMLEQDFRPDVYAKNIYEINYSKLKDAGVKLITFDIDETFEWTGGFIASSHVKKLFNDLNKMGFKYALLTNSHDGRAKILKTQINAWYSKDDAEKPLTKGFEEIRLQYEKDFNTKITPAEMAHVGNYMLSDIWGANRFGAISCLVRNKGRFPCICRIVKKNGHDLRKTLEEKKIWRKHHRNTEGDQYYDLGGTQEF